MSPNFFFKKLIFVCLNIKKADILELRRNFESMMQKFANLESSNHELNASLHTFQKPSAFDPLKSTEFMTRRSDPIDVAT